MFFAGCGMWKEVRSGDVVTAYLQSEQRKKVHAYKPSYANYPNADQENLATLRRGLLQILGTKGMAGIRKLKRKNRHDETHVWELLKAVYGRRPRRWQCFRTTQRVGVRKHWCQASVD